MSSGGGGVDVQVVVGNKKLLEEGEGLEVGSSVVSQMRSLEDRGCTVVLVAANGALLGLLAIQVGTDPSAGCLRGCERVSVRVGS